MTLNKKLAHYRKLRKSLITTEEQAATLFCRMMYGNGFQALADEEADLDGGYDEEDVEEKLESAFTYLDELAKATITEAIDSKLKEDV